MDGQPYAAAPVVPRPKIDPSAAAALSDEDREEEAGEVGEESLTGAAAAGAGGGGPAGGNNVKSVIMTVPQQAGTPAQTTAPQNNAQRPRRVHATKP
jgi:hypothetical protein